MSELQHAHYNALCAMLQDMRDYQKNGKWFKDAMFPIRPMKAWDPISSEESPSSEKWDALGYGWENRDFYPYIVNGLVFYRMISIPIDIMRGKKDKELRELLAPYKQELVYYSASFSLERELVKDSFNVMVFIDRNDYANHLFAIALGKG